MAVDTADKRYSMMGLAAPGRLVMPEPDGDISSLVDRQHLLGLYRGIEVETAEVIYANLVTARESAVLIAVDMQLHSSIERTFPSQFSDGTRSLDSNGDIVYWSNTEDSQYLVTVEATTDNINAEDAI